MCCSFVSFLVPGVGGARPVCGRLLLRFCRSCLSVCSFARCGLWASLFAVCSLFASLVRPLFRLVACRFGGLVARSVCVAVGSAFPLLVCRLSVRPALFGRFVLPLFLAVRAWFLGCGCGFVPLAPPKPQSIFVGSASRNQQKNKSC